VTDKNFCISTSFPRFLGFIAFLGVSQRWEQWEYKNTTTKLPQKNRVKKALHKKQNKKQAGVFLFSCFLLSFVF
jgi:hypothetical protein